METQSIARRILLQRMQRYTDLGPALGSLGKACFRVESSRLRVAYATVSAGRAGDVVDTVQRYARPRHKEVQWQVVPARPGEEELPAALLARGFAQTENLLLMAHRGHIRAPLAASVVVTPITTWQEIWQYEYGSRQAFYDDPHPVHALVNQRASERWHEIERDWCNYYVAWLDGKPVGGGYISLYEDVPTIMGLYTMPEARRRGVATALLARTIADTITVRNDVCCLYVEHGNPAERLYRHLGFFPLLDTQTYVWLAAP
jgi:GNAT superfamily N-acetyltransferase